MSGGVRAARGWQLPEWQLCLVRRALYLSEGAAAAGFELLRRACGVRCAGVAGHQGYSVCTGYFFTAYIIVS
jgi:hypothetical protein